MSINFEEDNILWIANDPCSELTSDPISNGMKLRQKIEPWLTAVFQSEHLSLLTGSGLTTAVTSIAEVTSRAMERIEFEIYKEEIKKGADDQAQKMDRGKANFEDDIRVAIELLKGLEILDDPGSKELKDEIDVRMSDLINTILKNEKEFLKSDKRDIAISYFKRFLISFASRTATKDRLNIFTTNYDRFIEYALDLAGIFALDRFIGKIQPVFRTNRIELDYHYNPPGIRGEPRYVEGVIRYTKLHGSLDWRMLGRYITRAPLSFGAEQTDGSLSKKPFDSTVIYPNSAKGIDTVFFPYSELFRDFSAAICRPNSVLITYGYGFGDSHINQIILDMLTIPSTHLVIISYDTGERVMSFIDKCNLSQITLLMGKHFSNFQILIDNYLPKAAIDRITERKQHIIEKRGMKYEEETSEKGDSTDE